MFTVLPIVKLDAVSDINVTYMGGAICCSQVWAGERERAIQIDQMKTFRLEWIKEQQGTRQKCSGALQSELQNVTKNNSNMSYVVNY